MPENNNPLLQGSVARSLVTFTIPIIFALFLQVMYGAVDMLIVGNFASLEDLSGVSTGSQLINTLTSLCAGFAMGTTVLLGQKIGEKKQGELGGVISSSLVLFLGFSLLVSLVMLFFHHEVLGGLNTPSNAWDQTSNYIFYSTLGIPLIFTYNVLGSIFRGLGDSKTPLLAVGVACGVNILGDLLLVAYFGMGSTGAAIATVVAQGTSVLVSLCIVRKRKLIHNILKVSSLYIKRVVVLGFPIALQSVLISLSFLFIAMVVNKHGVLFSASVGVTEKLTGIIMLVPIAFMQSISVFVAQNYGAKNFRRAKRGLCFGIIVSFSFGLVTGYLSFFHGQYLIGIFNSDPKVIATAVEYLKIYSFDVLLVPFMFCLTGYLNGCGKTVYVMIQGVIGAVFLRMGLTYYFSTIEPVSLFRIGLATPTATLVQIAMCVYFYIRAQKKSEL